MLNVEVLGQVLQGTLVSADRLYQVVFHHARGQHLLPKLSVVHGGDQEAERQG
jgi:hypothetical protein